MCIGKHRHSWEMVGYEPRYSLVTGSFLGDVKRLKCSNCHTERLVDLKTSRVVAQNSAVRRIQKNVI